MYLIINDGNIGCSGKWHSGDATDILPKLCPHLQPSITREGPEHSVDQIPLQRNSMKTISFRKAQ